MTLAIEWANLHIAGAFLVGWLVGTIVTLRLLRVVATVVRRDIPPPSTEGTHHDSPTR